MLCGGRYAATRFEDHPFPCPAVHHHHERLGEAQVPYTAAFLNRFLQPRLFYSISNGVESNATHNQNVLTAEVHVFF